MKWAVNRSNYDSPYTYILHPISTIDNGSLMIQCRIGAILMKIPLTKRLSSIEYVEIR